MSGGRTGALLAALLIAPAAGAGTETDAAVSAGDPGWLVDDTHSAAGARFFASFARQWQLAPPPGRLLVSVREGVATPRGVELDIRCNERPLLTVQVGARLDEALDERAQQAATRAGERVAAACLLPADAF